MLLDDFLALHGAALEANQVRNNLILGLLEGARGRSDHGFRLWSFDRPGACAIRTPGKGRGIILGGLNQGEARRLARDVVDDDYPSVQGTGDAPGWFVDEAAAQGMAFSTPETLHILALDRAPTRPVVPGAARMAGPEDAALLYQWTLDFIRDAGIPEPPPSEAVVTDSIPSGRHFFWQVDGRPVAMATLSRRMRDCQAIAPVFTLAEFRGRGFGGAITGHLVDRIFASGLSTACLFTDAENPSSNRCYEKLGFGQVCDSYVYRRTDPTT